MPRPSLVWWLQWGTEEAQDFPNRGARFIKWCTWECQTSKKNRQFLRGKIDTEILAQANRGREYGRRTSCGRPTEDIIKKWDHGRSPLAWYTLFRKKSWHRPIPERDEYSRSRLKGARRIIADSTTQEKASSTGREDKKEAQRLYC